MNLLSAVRFIGDLAQLDGVMERIKLMPCPHCCAVGFLIGHGWLWGYQPEQGSALRSRRGRRLLCSNRRRRRGCGRTFSILLASCLRRRQVSATLLWSFLSLVLAGWTRGRAWLSLKTPFTLRTAYRLWACMVNAQSRLRVMLATMIAPPRTKHAEPMFEALDHLRQALGQKDCPIHSFQLRLQKSFPI